VKERFVTIRRSVLGIVGACVLATSLAACGDSDEGASPTAAPGANKATGTPINIGWDNLEGGSVSFPETTQGFDAALEYVNNELGGVNGHVLTASVKCKSDGTTDSSVNCANRQVEGKVVLSVQSFDFGADAMLPVLRPAKVATLGGFPLTPGMNAAKGDAYWLVASSQEGYAADVAAQQSFGTKSLAMVLVDVPPSHAAFDDIVAPAAQRINMKIKAFYIPTQTDWGTQAASILASGADGISLFTGSGSNQAGVQALRAAGYKGPINAGADTSIMAGLSTAELKNVNFALNQYTPEVADLPADVKTELDAFTKYTAKYDLPAGKQAGAVQGWYAGRIAAEALKQVKGDNLTAADVYAAMPTIKGSSQPLRPSGYDCSKPTWPGTSACGTGAFYASPNTDKKLVLLPNQPVDISSVRPTS
jgi:branched-chain amino acid transport system substrate-binding protein